MPEIPPLEPDLIVHTDWYFLQISLKNTIIGPVTKQSNHGRLSRVHNISCKHERGSKMSLDSAVQISRFTI